jgi:hypothetical protein
MTDEKELQNLIKSQFQDMDNTQYEDLDEHIADHSNEGLKSPKSRSHKRRHFKHTGGSSLLPITERNERMMIHLSNMQKKLPKFVERQNIIANCLINIKNRLSGKLKDESSKADDLEIIGDYLESIEDFIPKMNPNAQTKWIQFVSDTKQEILFLLKDYPLSDYWKK